MPDGQHFAFLALARDLGLIQPEVAESLVSSTTPAMEAVVERQLLSPETVAGVVAALERGRFKCSGCGLSAVYSQLKTIDSLACPTCGKGLAYREPDQRQPRRPSERLAKRRSHSDRRPTSGLGPAPGSPSDRPSGLGTAPRHAPRSASDHASGLGPAPRPASDRRSGVGPSSGLSRPPKSDRHSGMGQTARPSSRRESPTRIGGFEVERELGRGNNGVVYLVRRPGLERQFALKVLLHTASLGDEARKRFRLEAQIGSKLNHPGIVPVYDIGEEDEVLFFAMEYVSGETLAERIKREGAFEPRAAAELIRDLAESMAEAHGQQVIHRDLKPGNVILPADGSRAKITDFGLARDRELAASMTKSGDILGTPFYMAPEQLQGARVTPQADVYALGVIFYQCLAGRRPYLAKTPFELAKRVMAGQCVPPRHIEPDVPRKLEAICLRALRVDPRMRTPSASALAEELTDFLEGRRVRAQTPVGGSKLPILLGAAVALILGIGLAIAVALALRTDPAFGERLASVHSKRPVDALQLTADLNALEKLDPENPQLAAAKRWAGGWQALWRADAAIARGALGEAKGALEEAKAAEGAGPFLADARAELLTLIDATERLLGLEAEARGQALSKDLLRRFRRLREETKNPLARARIQASLRKHLFDRQWLDEWLVESESLTGPAGAHRDLLAAWTVSEIGDRARAQREIDRIASGGDQIPEGVRLVAVALGKALRLEHDDAIPHLRRALRQDPDLEIAKLLLAIELAHFDRTPESQRLFAEYKAHSPDDVSFLIWQARVQVVHKKGQAALDSTRRAVRLLGSRLTEQVLVARLLAAQVAKDMAVSQRCLRIGKELYPNSTRLALLEGILVRDTMGSDAGDAIWIAAWKRNKQGFEAAARELLGGSAKQILEGIAQAVRRGGGNGRGQFFLPLGELLAPTEAALDRRPEAIKEPVARARVADLLVKLARGFTYEEVSKQLERALQAAPDDAALALIHAEILLGRDMLPEARAELTRCRKLGAGSRRVKLLEADVETRLGHADQALSTLSALCRPEDPRDVAWYCAKAQVVGAADQTEEGTQAAIKILRQCPTQDRFVIYTFIRIAYFARNPGLVRRAILIQFAAEGLFDSATLAFYCLAQTRRLSGGEGRNSGLLDHTHNASTRLFGLSKGAWTRLALAQLVLEGLPKGKMVQGWVRSRLESAESLQADHPRTRVLRGVHALISGRAVPEALAFWDRALELKADRRELEGWIGLLENRELRGIDVSKYLPLR
ncbi:MAG: protein kinase [Planctomycetes bacterium]|nr:protein kinase [Planctomycetota bacterium]